MSRIPPIYEVSHQLSGKMCSLARCDTDEVVRSELARKMADHIVAKHARGVTTESPLEQSFKVWKLRLLIMTPEEFEEFLIGVKQDAQVELLRFIDEHKATQTDN